MVQKVIRRLVILLLLITLLGGCGQEVSPQEKIYRDYLDACKVSTGSAVQEYCHYEIEAYFNDMIKNTAKVHSYDILEFKQLSDKLWVVKANIAWDMKPEGETVYNFVGEIDGEYKVMPSDIHVPIELKNGIDLSAYENPGL